MILGKVFPIFGSLLTFPKKKDFKFEFYMNSLFPRLKIQLDIFFFRPSLYTETKFNFSERNFIFQMISVIVRI